MSNEPHKKYRLLHKFKKLCTECKNPIISGKTLCSVHLEKKVIWRADVRAKLKEQNKCTLCQAPLIDGENLICFSCRSLKNRGNENPLPKGVINYETAN